MKLLRALVIGMLLWAAGAVWASAHADCVAGVVGCSTPPPGPRPTTTTTAPPRPAPTPTPTVPLPTTTTTQPRSAADPAAGERRLLVLMNQERTARGLGPLSRRADVDTIARAHSGRMAAKGTLWHNDDYFTAATKSALGASSLGENVARNDSVDDMHRRLMNSPRHRDNILNPRFSVVGIGLAHGGNGQYFGTENFVEPRAGAAHAPAAARPMTASRKPGGAAMAVPAAADVTAAAPGSNDVEFPLVDMAGVDVPSPLTPGVPGRGSSAPMAVSLLALTALAAVGAAGFRRLAPAGRVGGLGRLVLVGRMASLHPVGLTRRLASLRRPAIVRRLVSLRRSAIVRRLVSLRRSAIVRRLVSLRRLAIVRRLVSLRRLAIVRRLVSLRRLALVRRVVSLARLPRVGPLRRP